MSSTNIQSAIDNLNAVASASNEIMSNIRQAITAKNVTVNENISLSTINEDILKINASKPLNEQNLRIWNSKILDTTIDLKSITYGNGVYVAVGNNLVAYSYDRENWFTTRLSEVELGEIFNSICYIGSQGLSEFLIVSNKGNIRTIKFSNLNEILWTSYTNPDTSKRGLNRVRFINNEYIMVGDHGTIISGSSLNNLTKKVAPNTKKYLDIIFTGNEYIIVGDSCILTSEDGIQWSNSSFTTDTYFTGVTYANGKTVAVGYRYDNGSPIGVVYRKIDEESWEMVLSPDENLYKSQFNAITYSKGLFVAVGHRGFIAYSVDGETWILHNHEARNIFDIEFCTDEHCFIGCGMRGTLYFSDIPKALATPETVEIGKKFPNNYEYGVLNGKWSKYDYRTFAPTGLDTSIPDKDLEDIIYDAENDELYLASYSGSVYKYTGYVKNENSTIMNYITKIKEDETKPLYTISQSPDKIVVAGVNGYIAYIDKTATDNTTWTEINDLNINNADINHMNYANNMFIGVTSTGAIADTGSSAIITSTDGITWTIKDSGIQQRLNKIRYLNNLYIITTNEGKILYSKDLNSWTTVQIIPTPTNINMNSIVYGNGIYVASNSENGIYTSLDLITWTKNTSITSIITDIKFFKNKFFACGLSGVLLTSTDGITWTVKQTGTTENLLKLINVSSILYLIGSNLNDEGYIIPLEMFNDSYIPDFQFGSFAPTAETFNINLQFEPSKVIIMLEGQDIDGKRFCKINIANTTLEERFIVNGNSVSTYTIYNNGTDDGTFITEEENVINGNVVTVKLPSAQYYDGTCKYDFYAIK